MAFSEPNAFSIQINITHLSPSKHRLTDTSQYYDAHRLHVFNYKASGEIFSMLLLVINSKGAAATINAKSQPMTAATTAKTSQRITRET